VGHDQRALVLFMTVDLAFFYGGLEPHRNVLHMVAMNMFTIAIVTLMWVMLGSPVHEPSVWWWTAMVASLAIARPVTVDEVLASATHES
jgi:ammonia channel protein AmtB